MNCSPSLLDKKKEDYSAAKGRTKLLWPGISAQVWMLWEGPSQGWCKQGYSALSLEDHPFQPFLGLS